MYESHPKSAKSGQLWFGWVVALSMAGCSSNTDNNNNGPPPAHEDSGTAAVNPDAAMSTTDHDAGVSADSGEEHEVPDAGHDAGVNGPKRCGAGVTGQCVPTGNFGVQPGNNFAPLVLGNCADGMPYDFYGPEFFDIRATLLVASAGWCVPCQMEAPEMYQLIQRGTAPDGMPYAGRVRIISVYEQNPDYSSPTASFCSAWHRRYYNDDPAIIMVTDPMGVTERYFPMMAYPSNIVLGPHGEIVSRRTGFQHGLRGLLGDINSALAIQP